MAELEKRLRKAVSLGRKIHYLPPYRGETKLQLSALLGIKPDTAARLQVGRTDVRRGRNAREEERRGGRGDGTRVPDRLPDAHAGDAYVPPRCDRARDRGRHRGHRQIQRFGPVIPLDRLAARRDAPQPQRRRRIGAGATAVVRRRLRDRGRLLLATTRAPTPSAAGSRRSRRKFTTSYWRRTTM